MRNSILLILVLIICIGGICIIKHYNTDTSDTSKIVENSNLISNETSITNNNNNTSGQDNNITNNDSNIDTSKSNFEIVKVNDYNDNYEVEEPFKIISKDYFTVEKENNNVVITLIESSRNKELLKDNEKVTYNKKYIISNVSAENIDKIFCGGEGQELMYPVVYLLLKDGTVKGVDTENGYNTGNFKAETISGLNNVQKIEQTSVTRPNDSGYEAVVAITKDGDVYEIRQVD